MIVTYNKEQVGDVLMLTLKNRGEAKIAVERKGKVARVYREDNQETVAWNIFDASSFFAIEGKGQVFLTDEQVVRLNQELEREGFSERLVNDREPKFVVGEILEMVAHPDSDHLNICQVCLLYTSIPDFRQIQIGISVNQDKGKFGIFSLNLRQKRLEVTAIPTPVICV